MSGLKFFYGSYVHPAGEVYPQSIEVRPVQSDRGMRWASDIRMQVRGSFCADPDTPLVPATIDTKIAGLNAAYKEDYQDFGFRLSNNTNTKHVYLNDDMYNLSGNKVLSRSWLYQSPAEFANTRSFSVTLGARFLESYSGILYFKETLRKQGTGGEAWTYRSRWQGEPVRESVHEKTPVRIIQTGIIIGTTAEPTTPAPWWPDDEHKDMRLIEEVSPRLHGHLDFNRRTHYAKRYTYHFEMATDPFQAPNVWGA